MSMNGPDYFLRGDSNLVPSNAVVGMIVLHDGRYLMQLRSQKAGIFYPGHWGLFGGAVDPGEDADTALVRELHEELALDVRAASYFTEFSADFWMCGQPHIWRRYYKIELAENAEDQLVLGEGSAMRAFAAEEILNVPRVVPYDAFAIWLDATQRAQP